MRFEDVHEPVLYGHDLDAALAFVRGFQNTSAALASLSDAEATHAVERLRETLAAHYSDERGVVLDSRSWLITARHAASLANRSRNPMIVRRKSGRATGRTVEPQPDVTGYALAEN